MQHNRAFRRSINYKKDVLIPDDTLTHSHTLLRFPACDEGELDQILLVASHHQLLWEVFDAGWYMEHGTTYGTGTYGVSHKSCVGHTDHAQRMADEEGRSLYDLMNGSLVCYMNSTDAGCVGRSEKLQR